MLKPDTQVEFTVSDPWDFGTEVGVGPFAAVVEVVGPNPNDGGTGDAALLRLATPIEFKGTVCEYLVARARHEGQSVSSVGSGESVFCNLTCVPRERATSDAPLNLDWWRGGVALIGAVSRRPS